MIQSGEEFVDGVWAKSVAHFGTMECNTHCALADSSVIGDVGELETRNARPGIGVEDVGYSIVTHVCILSDEARVPID